MFPLARQLQLITKLWSHRAVKRGMPIEGSNFIRRSSEQLFDTFFPGPGKNWWAVGAEISDDRPTARATVPRKLFLALCSENLRKFPGSGIVERLWLPEIVNDNEGSGKFFEDEEMTRYFPANRLVSILSSQLLSGFISRHSIIFDNVSSVLYASYIYMYIGLVIVNCG